MSVENTDKADTEQVCTLTATHNRILRRFRKVPGEEVSTQKYTVRAITCVGTAGEQAVA